MLLKIYKILFERFGTQGWWPVTPIGGCKGDKAIAPIYGIRLKNDRQRLEIVFGAILTQNTSWKNVEKAVIELNKNDLIDVNKIINIDKKELALIIKSSGYHNQKAEKLKIFSDFLIKKYDGKVDDFFEFKIISKKKIKKSTDELRKELLSIKGIGPETADSIILYAAEKPVFVIDAYTKRIYSRIFNIKKELKYDELQKIFEKNLKKDPKLFNEYHALLVELGKKYCRKKPLCSPCPVSVICAGPCKK